MRTPDLSRRQLLHAAAAASIALPGTLAAQTAASPFWSKRISTRAEGSGPDVLVIPGLGSGPRVWTTMTGAVPGHRWHYIHVRGFAGLPAQDNAGEPLLGPIADEIARYILSAGLRRPAIIGHSMGGTLAMMVALRTAAMPGRLMVVDMLPAPAGLLGGTADGMSFLARQLRGYLTGTAAGRRAFAQFLRESTPGGRDSDPDVIADALDEMAALDLTAELPALRVPLTVVPGLPGDHDGAQLLLGRTKAAYRGATRARIVPIQPSGHMVMLDQPAMFADAVRAFLR